MSANDTTDIKLHVDQKKVRRPAESLIDGYRQKMGELIDLSPEQRDRLAAFLKEQIGAWEGDTADLHEQLLADNDLLEGIVPEQSGALSWGSNVHVGLPDLYMQIYASTLRRSILGSDSIWFADSDNEELLSVLPDVESAINYTAINKWNIKQAVEDVCWTTPRDGLGVIQAVWAEDFEKVRDILLITSEEEFDQNFPGAEDAGLDADAFEDLKNYIRENASEETPVEIPVTYMKEKYRGVDAKVIDRVNFVTLPATVESLDDPMLRGYGKRYRESTDTIRRKVKQKVYYKEAAEKLLSKSAESSPFPSYILAQDDIEGLSRESKKGDRELFELIVKGSLDGDEGEFDTYLVTYSLEKNVILRCIYNPYREDICATFWIDRRPNRLGGRSLLSKLRDASDETDTQHNQRINARTITTVPVFKALNKAKKSLDPDGQGFVFEPGKPLWVEDMMDIEQWKIQPTDLGESLQEEGNARNLLDLRLGVASSLLSGQPDSMDRNAPGNKTAILINQSNLRMDDPLNQFRHGIEHLGKIVASHIYQFGDPFIKYKIDVADKGGLRSTIRTVHRKFFRKDINFKMKAVTVVNNPDFEMQKLLQIYSILAPELAENPELRQQILRDAMKEGRIRNRDKYLPSAEVLGQQVAMKQAQAMKMLQAEQQEQSRQAMLKTAQENLKLRSTAQRLAKEGLGFQRAA